MDSSNKRPLRGWFPIALLVALFLLARSVCFQSQYLGMLTLGLHGALRGADITTNCVEHEETEEKENAYDLLPPFCKTAQDYERDIFCNYTERRTGPVDKEAFANSFREEGGIIIFVHIPKTAGSMIRSFLSSQCEQEPTRRRCRYIATHNKLLWDETEQLVDSYLSNGTMNGDVLLVEDHVFPNIPGVLIPTVTEWRQRAAANKINIFMFTVLREPVSHAVSHFNYFFVIIKRIESKENALLNYTFNNLQANFLGTGSKGSLEGRTRRFLDVQEKAIPVLEAFDYVGLVENCDAHLLPLLSYLANLENLNLGIVQPKGYTAYKLPIMELDKVSNATKYELQHRTHVDRQLYDYARARFDHTEWTDYLKSKGALERVACGWNKKKKKCTIRTMVATGLHNSSSKNH